MFINNKIDADTLVGSWLVVNTVVSMHWGERFHLLYFYFSTLLNIQSVALSAATLYAFSRIWTRQRDWSVLPKRMAEKQ